MKRLRKSEGCYQVTFQWVVYLLFLWVSQVLAQDSGRSADKTPYPYSHEILGISWDLKSHHIEAPGSDNWPTTWAADGNIYTSWGDGGGFGGTNDLGRASLGVARVSGSMSEYKGTNIWGGVNTENPATFSGKSYGLLSVDGILYMALFSQEQVAPYKVGQIAYSKDQGKRFHIGPTFNHPDAAFAVMTFLNFGQDYQGARDDFVYLYAGQTLSGCIARCLGVDYYLARVPKQRILERDAYQFFTGRDERGLPLWVDAIEQRKAVFSDAAGASVRFGVVYHPQLKKYLLSNSHDNLGGMGVFESDQPWGPWRTVVYYENWLGFGYSPSYHIAAQKWMSQDGKIITMVFSSEDQLNTLQGTLILP